MAEDQLGQRDMSKVWSVLAIILIIATTISRNVTDLFFVSSGLIILYYEARRNDWRGLRQVFLKLGFANYLIWIFIFANILGYFFSTKIGPLQLDEILSLRWILCFYGCVYLGMNLKFSEKVFRYTAIAYVLALLIGVWWQYFIDKKYDRLEGVFENSNVAAFSMALPWIFLVTWESVSYLRTKNTDWLLVCLSLVMEAMLFFTYGRGTWMAMGVVFLVVSVLMGLKRNLIVLLCVVGLAVGAYRENIFGFKDRVLYSFDLSAGNSQGVRIRLWQANWAIFLDYPVFGVGYFENKRMEVPYYGKLGITNYEGDSREQYHSHAHNQFLQILVGGGLVGFLSYFLLFGRGLLFLYQSYKGARTELMAKFAMGGFSMVLIFWGMGVVDSPLVSSISRNSFLIFVGLCFGLILQKDRVSTLMKKEKFV